MTPCLSLLLRDDGVVTIIGTPEVMSLFCCDARLEWSPNSNTDDGLGTRLNNTLKISYYVYCLHKSTW